MSVTHKTIADNPVHMLKDGRGMQNVSFLALSAYFINIYLWQFG
jgi:hypothetical protein